MWRPAMRSLTLLENASNSSSTGRASSYQGSSSDSAVLGLSSSRTRRARPAGAVSLISAIDSATRVAAYSLRT